jgi:hypothetical protein
VSKKKFKVGLESLFGDVGDDQLPGIRPLLVEEEAQKQKSNKTSTSTKRPKRRSAKNFTSDLEGLFHNALDQGYKETAQKKSSTKSRGRDTTIKKRKERPVIGIDALIRKTSETSRDTFASNTPLKKRVTFILEKHKIEQLKSIAKSKKAYLKDVVDQIISEYLDEYPDQKTVVN